MGKSRSNILGEYIKKRKFLNTPEPIGKTIVKTASKQVSNDKVFTIQKHQASHLHYDFRLEDENGVLKSWAVPKGPSLNPQTKRLAVLTEDHPYDYLLFEGTIPKGNYGAGTVIVWDDMARYRKAQTTCLISLKMAKYTIDMYGKKLHGKFSLIRTKTDNQWLLIKSNDEFASAGEEITVISPNSALSGKYDIASVDEEKLLLNTGVQRKPKGNQEKKTNSMHSKNTVNTRKDETLEEDKLPLKIKPMLAIPVIRPFSSKDWVYEIKWDGVRAIISKEKKENDIILRSRNDNEITLRYPEIIEALEGSLADWDYTILDGEIVVVTDQMVFQIFRAIKDVSMYKIKWKLKNSLNKFQQQFFYLMFFTTRVKILKNSVSSKEGRYYLESLNQTKA